MRSTEALVKFFEPGSMNIRTLNSAIERGDVPGMVFRNGGRPSYFVDTDQFTRKTGNELVDRVMERVGQDGG